MIISRTPVRISFAGGGTDVRYFFMHEGGAVVNASINKYVYITIHRKFDEKIRVKYSQTELVERVEDIQHPLFREAMRLVGVTGQVEITSFADIPTKGTGLGSSSSFLVGLLHALHAYKREFVEQKQLAREACRIERDILQEEGGYQDQYIAAYGGLNFMEFRQDGSVEIMPLYKQGMVEALNQRLLLFYTGMTRNSRDIHQQQRKNAEKNREYLRRMKQFAEQLRIALEQGKYLDMGSILHEGWKCKEQLADGVSNKTIDTWYEKALIAGALGGKLCGVGGGGFLLFYCEPEKQENVRKALKDMKELPFQLENSGSRIIYAIDNEQYG
ncbi:kinase [Candidatus Woesearchaeota archaeon]|nr:kinase [Candidatus Woesearchaeota archaeon]